MPLAKKIKKTPVGGLVAVALNGAEVPVTHRKSCKVQISVSENDRASYPDVRALKEAAIRRFVAVFKKSPGEPDCYCAVREVKEVFESTLVAGLLIDYIIYSPVK